MKNIFKSMIGAVALLAMTACNDGLDDLTGKYDLDTYRFNTVDEQVTTKLGKGVKKIEISLVDGKDTLDLAFGSKEWVLPAVSYNYMPADEKEDDYSAAVTNGGFAASLRLDTDTVKLGNETSITVSRSADGTYDLMFISILEGRNNIKCTYTGPINFEIGEDDPEASGYTIDITENAVTDADNNVYDGLTKYAIVVADPEGNAVFEVDAVNRAGATMDDLVGTYTIQGYPCEAWLADNGWVVYLPEWGVEMAGGSYYTDAEGVKRYITSGQINITRAEDADGNPLYSFSGSDLSTLTAQNVAGTGGSFNVTFASYIVADQTGTVLRDQTIHSDVLGRDMLYSVYLPASWSAEDARTYPVLYLLHGANSAPIYGDGSPANNGWIDGGQIDKQVDLAVAAGTAPEMIVIMPNCTVDGQDLFYVDGYQGDAQYMTYFFTEFLPTVEAQYKAKADRAHRAVGGFSMGGYGSLYYGALHPEMFSYVYACSPAIIIDGTPNVFDLYGAALGSESGLPGITVEIGTSDFLFEQSTWFDGFMQGIGVPYEYITREGTHDWAFWKACAPKIVKKMGEVFPAE